MAPATGDVNLVPTEEENTHVIIDYDEDIFKLEAPTFTTIDRGPPEPVHRNMKLRWDHEVNLIGQKVLNPTIHVCQKCNIPILIYGRMIPCKHVFCHDCAVKAEKICPRCGDKVNRVEQVMLGTLFMCTHGSGTKRSGNDACSRTYLSQRDLQAHINHRHLRQSSTDTTLVSSASSTTPTKSSISQIDARQHLQMQQRHQQLQQNMNSIGHCSSTTVSANSHQMSVDYNRGAASGRRAPPAPPPQALSVMPQAIPAYPVSTDHHRTYDRQNNMMLTNPTATQQTIMTSAYSLNLVTPQTSQVVGMGPQAMFGTSQMPIVNSSAAAAAAAAVAASRTNLITVPIHDDSVGHSQSDYMQYNPHQPPPQAQQQGYMQGPQSQYSTGPPISYGTVQTYGSSTVVTSAFPPPQAPPNTHYPPPPMYATQPPAVPQCYPTQPPPTHRYPITGTRYDDHSQLGSPQYTHAGPLPPTAWNANQQQQNQHNICVPPPSMASQSRPPFYHT